MVAGEALPRIRLGEPEMVTKLPSEGGTLLLWHLCSAERDLGGRVRAELLGAERRDRSRRPASCHSLHSALCMAQLLSKQMASRYLKNIGLKRHHMQAFSGHQSIFLAQMHD